MRSDKAKDVASSAVDSKTSYKGTNSAYEQTSKQAGSALKSARRKKSAAAFRTISEVADDLGVKQHVLRFWETKFSQLKPLKRGGGRRYYRPEDIALLKAIYRLLYIEGYTIKGVQKLLREAGKKQIVAVFSQDQDAADVQVSQSEPQEAKEVTVKANSLSAEQREALQAVLDELKELRGMIKPRSSD